MPLINRQKLFNEAIAYLKGEGYTFSDSMRLYAYPTKWCSSDGRIIGTFMDDNGATTWNRLKDLQITSFIRDEFFYRRQRLSRDVVLKEDPTYNQKPEDLLQLLIERGYDYNRNLRCIVSPDSSYAMRFDQVANEHERNALIYLWERFQIAYSNAQNYRVTRR